METANIIHLTCLGACLLATIYHSVLYIYYRDKLLLYYVAYLGFMSCYIFIRNVLYALPIEESYVDKIVFYFNEPMQVFYFTLYINFAARAVEVEKNKKSFVYKGWILLSSILIIYGIAVFILHQFNVDLHVAFYTTIRLFIFGMCFVLLWRTILMTKSTFHKWILAGCIYFFICGLMSFISNTRASDTIIFHPTEWLQIGNFGEILFFSSALGYRIKKAFEERQDAIKIANDEKEKTKKIEFEKTKEIMQTRLDERNRIAKDMHDELGSGLTKIAILTEVIKKDPLNAEKNIDKISETSRQLVDNLDEMVWSLNPKNDSLDKLMGYLAEYVNQFLEATTIKPIIILPVIITPIYVSEERRRNIFMVLKEFLNNTVKYSTAKSFTLQMIQFNTTFTLVLKDDGKGFDINKVSKMGNGLKNMQQRINNVGGKANLESNNTGTSLEMHFKIPLY